MILLLPRLFALGIDVPILGGLANRMPWALAIFGLAVYVALCMRTELGARREG
jgi:hypothetical protein